IVEYAITRLRLVTTRPIVAAISSVRQPTIAPTSAAAGACSKSGCMRAIRYTPAVTIVAAWIRAETGVGPSIASGSQVCSGTWADFANAPTSSSRQPATRSPSLRPNSPAASNARRKSSEPTCLKMKYVPSTRPTSPTTLITNALMPAAVAVVRRYQNEIRKYDAAPTNAQPMISMRKFAASTSSSMLNTKKFRYEKNRAYPASPPMYDTDHRWISIDTPETTSIMNTLSGSSRIATCASTPVVAA